MYVAHFYATGDVSSVREKRCDVQQSMDMKGKEYLFYQDDILVSKKTG